MVDQLLVGDRHGAVRVGDGERALRRPSRPLSGLGSPPQAGVRGRSGLVDDLADDALWLPARDQQDERRRGAAESLELREVPRSSTRPCTDASSSALTGAITVSAQTRNLP